MKTSLTIDLKKVQHIIFDFDGVIAETDNARYKVLANILQRYKINLKAKYKQSDLVGIPTDIFLHNKYPNL